MSTNWQILTAQIAIHGADKSIFKCITPREVVEKVYKPLLIEDTLAHLLPIPANSIFLKFKTIKDWDVHVQTDGIRYFYRKSDRILTTSDIFDEEIRTYIEEKANVIKDRLDELSKSIDIPTANREIFIMHMPEEKEPCGYYIVSHETQRVFWLETNLYPKVYTERSRLHGVKGLAHLQYAIEMEYWCHWWLFPNTQRVTPDLIQLVKDAIIFHGFDMVVSTASLSPYTQDDYSRLLSQASNLSKDSTNQCGYTAYVIGGLMFKINQKKFVHFHAEKCVRLKPGQSIFEGHDNHRFFIVLSVILLWAPWRRYKLLGLAKMDGVVDGAYMIPIISSMQSEWRDAVTTSSLFLIANVNILNIKDLDQTTKVANFVSFASNLTCLAFSLWFINFTRGQETNGLGPNTGPTALPSILPTYSRRFLSVVFSIPLAMMYYGILSFGVALVPIIGPQIEIWKVTITLSILLGFFLVVVVYMESPPGKRYAKWCSSYSFTLFSKKDDPTKAINGALEDATLMMC